MDASPAGRLYLPKTLSYSSRISSTIWFWYTMWTAMLPVSVSGRSSVGPKTMATLWVVIRLASPCSITLETERKESRGQKLEFLIYAHLTTAKNQSDGLNSPLCFITRSSKRSTDFLHKHHFTTAPHRTLL